jgi:RND superfamily putative drug exporter
VRESLANTEITTVILVVLALVVIYRAPLLVLVPLATIGVSLLTAYSVVALCAQHLGPDDIPWGGFKIFTTTKIFVVVILFGAGTDFCLFLIARFKEELGEGVPLDKASGTALVNVGDALAASAFTTILGLATMAFADYGKFVYSGPIVALCLFIALIACVTFAPALLRLLGKVVFWPFGVDQMTGSESGGQTDSKIWRWVADCVLARPGTILFASAWLALPFIVWGFTWVEVSHDFMAELAPERQSVQGTQLIRDHFAPGEVAPTLIVAENRELDLDAKENTYALAYLHGFVTGIEGVADVRSQYLPAGKLTGGNVTAAMVSGSPAARENFISDTGEFSGRVTQLQVILDKDPFSREARAIVERIEQELAKVTSGEATNDPSVDDRIREGLAGWKGTRFELGGTTPGIRDLERVTISDQTRIQVCVVLAVFAVIWVILRNFKVCVYLIITVLLSYFATIGMTDMFFTWLWGDSFDGLDWKVPIFLFVILIAVGQDYNIYLTTRVFEEQRKLGMRAGLRRGLIQTGGIITSCGIIMAGTFVSMSTGTLRAMIELGFSLSLGVLLDTFFVRTVVVPCFFALTARSEEPSMELPAYDVDEAQQDEPQLDTPLQKRA